MAEGLPHFHSLVLAGGGPMAISFIGCVEYLEHTCMLGGIRTFVGCSAGSLLGLLLALGMSAKDVRRFLTDTLRREGCHTIDVEQALNFLSTWGLDDGARVTRVLSETMTTITGRPDMTFLELAKHTGRDLVVCVSNLSTQEHEFMCVDRTPNMSVLKAVRMSTAIPILFTPVWHEGSLYVDGGIYNNFPIDYCVRQADTSALDVLALNIAFEGELPAMDDRGRCSLPQYLWALVASVMKRSNKAAFASAQPAAPRKREGEDTEKPEDKHHYRLGNALVVSLDDHEAQAHESDAEFKPMNFSLTDLMFDISDEYISACTHRGYAVIQCAMAAHRKHLT